KGEGEGGGGVGRWSGRMGMAVPARLRSRRMLLMAARPSCCISARATTSSVVCSPLVTIMAAAVITMDAIARATSASTSEKPPSSFRLFVIGISLPEPRDVRVHDVVPGPKLRNGVLDCDRHKAQVGIRRLAARVKDGGERYLALEAGEGHAHIIGGAENAVRPGKDHGIDLGIGRVAVVIRVGDAVSAGRI